jgi:G:T-mismatch repair DNA endonuclease (very short patch repair protein)
MINLTTTDQRRRLMQRVRRENTAPEIMVAKMLKAKGIM